MKDRATFEYARILRQVSAIEPSPAALEQALSRTRNALSAAREADLGGASENAVSRNGRILRAAARIAAGLVVASLGIGFFFFVSSGEQVFAQVQSALAQAPAISFTVEIVKSPKGVVVKPGTVVADLVENRFRFEAADGSEIFVIDGKNGTSMMLLAKEQRAVVWRHRSPDNWPSFMELVKGLRDGNAAMVERMNDAELDGRTVHRYRVPPGSPLSGGEEMMISVNPRTHLPVRIDSTTDALGGPLHIVSKDFSFDPVDPALFATVPPADYRVDSDAVPAPIELAPPGPASENR